MTSADHGAAWFDLNGTCLRVTARDDHLRPLLPYLAELRCAGPGGNQVAAAARFELSIAPQLRDPAPEGATLIHDGSLPEGGPCQLFEQDGSRLLIVPGRLSARFSPALGLGSIGVVPGSERLIGGTAGILAIEAAACVSGQVLLHAAALVLPGRDEAVMVFARSGAGKTTAALALAMAGFGFLTDDAVFLAAGSSHAGSPHTVWGLPRPLKVHARTAQMLPAVGALLTGEWDAEGEQALSRAALASLAPVPPARPVPLAAIILLDARAAAHRMAPARRADILVRLAEDNVTRGPRGVLAPEMRRFDATARAIAATKVFQLNVGNDLASLPAVVLEALA